MTVGHSATRPPFALGRLHVRADGNVSYRVKKKGRNGSLCRVMTPVPTRIEKRVMKWLSRSLERVYAGRRTRARN